MQRKLRDLAPIKDLIKVKALEECEALTDINSYASIRINVEDIVKEYLEAQGIQDPTWFITATAYAKMRLLVDTYAKEVGWYGTVEKHDNNMYVINDIIVYPQYTSGATCEQDEDRMFDFEMSLTDTQVNTKRFQGHSHVNMGVTPSSVDETFYEHLMTQVTDFFMIVVTNKAGAIYTRFYDIANNIVYTDLPIHIIDEAGNVLAAWADKELAEKIVARPVLTQTYSSGHSYSTIFKDDNDDEELYWDPKRKERLTYDEYRHYYKKNPPGYKKQQKKKQDAKQLQAKLDEMSLDAWERQQAEDEEFYKQFRT